MFGSRKGMKMGMKMKMTRNENGNEHCIDAVWLVLGIIIIIIYVVWLFSIYIKEISNNIRKLLPHFFFERQNKLLLKPTKNTGIQQLHGQKQQPA